MIIPAKENHKLYQGATWERRYKVVDEANQVVDIDGCTATLSARENVEDDEVLFSVEGVVDNGNPNTGEVLFTIPADTCEAHTWERAYFDAELYWPGGKIDKLAHGTFKLIREVTRI